MLLPAPPRFLEVSGQRERYGFGHLLLVEFLHHLNGVLTFRAAEDKGGESARCWLAAGAASRFAQLRVLAVKACSRRLALLLRKRIVWQETLNIVQRGLCLTPCAEGGYIRWRRPPPEAQLARAQGVFWPVNCGPSMGASVPNDCKSLGRHKAHTSEGTGSSCKTSAK